MDNIEAIRISVTDDTASLDRSSGRASFLVLTARCARVAPITAPAVTIPSYPVGYDERAGRSSSGDVGATCLIRIQFRCSAAKAALRFTKSSKLKRARRPSIRKRNGCWDLEAMTSIGEIKARSQLRREYSRINQAARKLPDLIWSFSTASTHVCVTDALFAARHAAMRPWPGAVCPHNFAMSL
jgi:hypothetical protein